MSDAVNHPSHYNKEGRKECIVEMLEKFGPVAVYWSVFLAATSTTTAPEIKTTCNKTLIKHIGLMSMPLS